MVGIEEILHLSPALAYKWLWLLVRETATLHVPHLIHYIQCRRQYCFSYSQTCIEHFLCAKLYGKKYEFGSLEFSLQADIQLIIFTQEKCTPGKKLVAFICYCFEICLEFFSSGP